MRKPSLLERLRHWFNPLHLFCRLRECGLSEPKARRVGAAWEWIYSRPRVALLVALTTGLVLLCCTVAAHAGHDHPEHWYRSVWRVNAEIFTINAGVSVGGGDGH